MGIRILLAVGLVAVLLVLGAAGAAQEPVQVTVSTPVAPSTSIPVTALPTTRPVTGTPQVVPRGWRSEKVWLPLFVREAAPVDACNQDDLYYR